MTAAPQNSFVIANADQTQFRTWGPTGPEWTSNPDEAIAFARREDAEKLAANDEDAWAIIPRDLAMTAVERMEAMTRALVRRFGAALLDALGGRSIVTLAELTGLSEEYLDKLLVDLAAGTGDIDLREMASLAYALDLRIEFKIIPNHVIDGAKVAAQNRAIREALRGGNGTHDNAKLFEFLADRLVHEHGENENLDYIHAARKRAKMIREALKDT